MIVETTQLMLAIIIDHERYTTYTPVHIIIIL